MAEPQEVDASGATKKATANSINATKIVETRVKKASTTTVVTAERAMANTADTSLTSNNAAVANVNGIAVSAADVQAEVSDTNMAKAVRKKKHTRAQNASTKKTNNTNATKTAKLTCNV